jgi:hypothetical protein
VICGPLEEILKREKMKFTALATDPRLFWYLDPMGHNTTGAKFGRSRSRGFGATRMRFSGFPFEWDMAYNNLP